MTDKLKAWWESFGGSWKPAVTVLAVIVGLLVAFNGAFFVANYFPTSCRACHYMDP